MEMNGMAHNQKGWTTNFIMHWGAEPRLLETYLEELKRLRFGFSKTHMHATGKRNMTGYSFPNTDWAGTYDEWQLNICQFLRIQLFLNKTSKNDFFYSVWNVSWHFKNLRNTLNQYEPACRSRNQMELDVLNRKRSWNVQENKRYVEIINKYNRILRYLAN
jgi:hypothetical protein